jgi:hypothetical protein
MTTWDYRLIKLGSTLLLAEVYYDNNNKPYDYNEDLEIRHEEAWGGQQQDMLMEQVRELAEAFQDEVLIHPDDFTGTAPPDDVDTCPKLEEHDGPPEAAHI